MESDFKSFFYSYFLELLEAGENMVEIFLRHVKPDCKRTILHLTVEMLVGNFSIIVG